MASFFLIFSSVKPPFMPSLHWFDVASLLFLWQELQTDCDSSKNRRTRVEELLFSVDFNCNLKRLKSTMVWETDLKMLSVYLAVFSSHHNVFFDVPLVLVLQEYFVSPFVSILFESLSELKYLSKREREREREKSVTKRLSFPRVSSKTTN